VIVLSRGQLPVEIGAFLNAGVIVYMAVIIVGGFLISIFGPGLQCAHRFAPTPPARQPTPSLP
jgi:hypothetical protein